MTDAKRMDITKNLELIEKSLKHIEAIEGYLYEAYGITVCEVGTQLGCQVHLYAGIELVEEALRMKGRIVSIHNTSKEILHNDVRIFQIAQVRTSDYTFQTAIAEEER